MIKAGIKAFLVVFLLLITFQKAHAESPDYTGASHFIEDKLDICKSSLNPYMLTFTVNCESKNWKQTPSNNIYEDNRIEEFSIKHSFEIAENHKPVKIVSKIEVPEVLSTIIVTEKEVEPYNNNPDVILDLINAHRKSIGKTPFLKDEALCSLAKTRSSELRSELNRGVLHSGLYNRGFSYNVIENAKTGGDEAETVRWWLNSPIHRKAIESNYIYSCGGCTGNNCSQLFTSYNPKTYRLSSNTLNQ